jgi:hypothetical protein
MNLYLIGTELSSANGEADNWTAASSALQLHLVPQITGDCSTTSEVFFMKLQCSNLLSYIAIEKWYNCIT